MTKIPAALASAIPPRARALSGLETLAIGTAGGMLFLWAHLPGGLISGAMIAVGAAAIMGRPTAVPPLATQAVLVVLGISLGSVVSRRCASSFDRRTGNPARSLRPAARRLWSG